MSSAGDRCAGIGREERAGECIDPQAGMLRLRALDALAMQAMACFAPSFA